MQIEVPMPPSVNNLFVNNPRTRGRFPSAEYKAWRKEASVSLTRYPHEVFEPNTHWQVHLNMFFANSKINKCDLDNRIKPMVDLICEWYGLDDRYLIWLMASKNKSNEKRSYIKATIMLTGPLDISSSMPGTHQ